MFPGATSPTAAAPGIGAWVAGRGAVRAAPPRLPREVRGSSRSLEMAFKATTGIEPV